MTAAAENSPPCRWGPEVSPEDGSRGRLELQPAVPQDRVEVTKLRLQSEQTAEGHMRQQHGLHPNVTKACQCLLTCVWHLAMQKAAPAGGTLVSKRHERERLQVVCTGASTSVTAAGPKKCLPLNIPSVPAPDTLSVGVLGPILYYFLLLTALPSGLRKASCISGTSVKDAR